MTDQIEEQQEVTPLTEEQQQFITNKIQLIHNSIGEIGELAPDIGDILANGFILSMNLIEAVALNGVEQLNDVSKKIELVSAVLGFDLEEMVKHAVEQSPAITGMMVENAKEPDEETLKFITSDMDDYERFLAEAKAKDSLDFLKKEL